MKKPKIEAEEQTPRKVVRADKAPTTGYSLVVDGHFKSHHDTVEAAEEEPSCTGDAYATFCPHSGQRSGSPSSSAGV